MPRYQGSTHCLHWLFERQQLSNLRQEGRLKVAQRLRDIVPQASPVQLELTEEEGNLLIVTLVQTLFKLGKHLGFSANVAWTAATYLQRYYLLNSLYDCDPMQLMFTSLFLATKSEEVNVTLKTICNVVKGCEEKRVKVYEITLLKGINFQLYVYSPYRPFECVWTELRESILEPDREAIKTACFDFMESALLTDWPFLEPPAVIAVTAIAAVLHSRIDLEELIQSLLEKHKIQKSARELIILGERIKAEEEMVKRRSEGQEMHFKSSVKKVMGIHKRLQRGREGQVSTGVQERTAE